MSKVGDTRNPLTLLRIADGVAAGLHTDDAMSFSRHDRLRPQARGLNPETVELPVKPDDHRRRCRRVVVERARRADRARARPPLSSSATASLPRDCASVGRGMDSRQIERPNDDRGTTTAARAARHRHDGRMGRAVRPPARRLRRRRRAASSRREDRRHGRCPPFADDGRASGSSYRNFNKRGVVLDVDDRRRPRTPARAAARCRRVHRVDARLGDLASLGLSPQSLPQLFPRLVVCSITPFGQTGPYAHHVATDDVVFALSGWLATSGIPSKPPLLVPGILPSDAASVIGVFAVLSALIQRRTHRPGPAHRRLGARGGDAAQHLGRAEHARPSSTHGMAHERAAQRQRRRSTR